MASKFFIHYLAQKYNQVKKNWTFFLLFMACCYAFSQNTEYPQGAYFTIEDLVFKIPSLNTELKVHKRSVSDLKWNSGNDYKLKNDAVSRKTIRKKILAYSDGKSTYINCLRYKIQDGYSLIQNSGRYLVFTAGLSSELSLKTYQLQRNENPNFWKYIGVKGQDISKIDKKFLRFLYVIDTKTNLMMMIDEIGMRKLLVKADAELLEKYNREIDETDDKEKTVFKFLELLNASESI